jgi:glycosyltransferase involved in cell wall biosynthesis
MRTVVINALNLNLGGGRSIRDSFLHLLNADQLVDRHVVFIAQGTNPGFVDNPNIVVVELPDFCSQTVAAPFVYRFLLGRLARRHKADVILNFCDVIIHTPIKQIYVLDFPYVFDVHPHVWEGMSLWFRALIFAKVALHHLNFHRPNAVVAQTELARDILIRKYGLKDVRVIGNAVTLNVVAETAHFDVALPDKKTRFLCPCTYHPHKNVEVLLDVGDLIRQKGFDACIVTTIDASCAGGARFIDGIRARGLESVVVNVGQMPLPQMRRLYEHCDGVLMPTLLESFSIVYVEAMQHRLPIVTSDLWFARVVCEDAALYVNPLDPSSIVAAIEMVVLNEAARAALVEAGAARLAKLPGWPEIYARFRSLINEFLRSPTDGLAVSAAEAPGTASLASFVGEGCP